MPVFLLTDKFVFPPPHLATKEGLLAVGGDLDPARLLAAYKKGIFPWYSNGEPILWWSPDPRLVLYPEELKISHSLAKILRKNLFQVSMDRGFRQVIGRCASIRSETRQGTWISGEMIEAYCRLHQLGYAHSVEIWHKGDLVGGLYGLCIGRCYFGESMFSTMSNTSKVALVFLCRYLREHQIDLIDCQVHTDHLVRMGARNIARKDFIKQLNRALKHPSLKGTWNLNSSNKGSAHGA